MSHIVNKRLCSAVSEWTGQKCGAKAVGPNTLKRGTREFLDDRYCQMHQPGRKSKKKCVCPHCHYHRSRDLAPIVVDGGVAGDKKLKASLSMDEATSGWGKKVKGKKPINIK